LSRLTTVLFIILTLTVAACSGGGDDEDNAPPPDPRAMLQRAADLMQEAETFSLEVIQAGAPFIFEIDLGEGVIGVRFNRAIGQFVQPGEVLADVSVRAGLPIDMMIYANGPDQWYNAPLIGWINEDFAEDFDPTRMVRDDGGFESAVGALQALNYEGRDTINGVGTYHFSGEADGLGLSDLLVGLIVIEGIVPVDVHIDRETGYPVRLIIEQPGTATEDHPENTRWQVDVFGINADDEIVRPQAQGS
jgi:hypothetical protein